MLEVDAAAGTLTIAIWAAGTISAVFLALVVLAIGRAGVAASMNVLFRVAIVAIAVSAGWLYSQRMERQEQAAELRLLDDRLAALSVRAVAPGSALSCLDELAGETVEAACEKAVFASPEAVSAAVAYVTAKLALLADRSHVLANFRDHIFDEQVAKFAAIWNNPSRVAIDGAAAELPRPTPAPLTVSPRYDFPSSQSIPPVNIMAPEQPAPKGPPNGQSVAPSGDGNPRPAVAPVPPRRPPQGRTPTAAVGSRPSGSHQAAPVAVGEAPTDGAGTRPSGSGLQ